MTTRPIPESARKHQDLAKLQDSLAIQLGGRTKEQAAKEHVCVSCQQPILCFRDRLSRTEYNISGLCQTCQDEVFGEKK